MRAGSGNYPVRVVLVDASDQIRSLLKRLFAATDDVAVVGEANDGLQAIAEVERTHPDVVVMAMVMPVMDGLEATLAIRTQHPDIHVISFTGSAEEVAPGTYGAVIRKTDDVSLLLQEIRRVRNRS